MHLVPGTQLGRYELLNQIAQGGMASVWAARQSGSHGFRKTVAVKTMLPGHSRDPELVRMFLREAQLATRLHHPNVAETLDLGEDQGLLYIVMEWVDGESVSTLLKRVELSSERIPLRLAAGIALRAAHGIHAAHELTDDDDRPLGVVHRDISPQNVMITYDGHVKVVDFGVAKTQGEAAQTSVGQLKGKVPYMSPEQAGGQAIDRRTDVFAFGTMLYRMTTGKHPFLGSAEVMTLNNIIHVDPRPPAMVIADYPEELARIVMRCLAKLPDDRYATMLEVASDLQQWVGTPAVSDQEVATFVRLHLGEVRKQRREAMRDAAKALGWAVNTSQSLPTVTAPENPADGSGSYDGVTRAHGSSHSVSANIGSSTASIASPGPARPWRRAAVIVALIGVSAVAGTAFSLVLASRAGGQGDVRTTDTIVGATQPETPPTATATGTTHAADTTTSAGPTPTTNPSATTTSAATVEKPPAATQGTRINTVGRPTQRPATKPTGTPSHWSEGTVDMGF